MFRYFPDRLAAILGSPLALALVVLACAAGCVNAGEPAARGARTAVKKAGVQYGKASWHAPSRVSGECRTASGQPWANEDMVAAHRSLPLGAKVRVINLKNGRDAIVQITDRGPYGRGRIIDLSLAAARELDMVAAGTGQVRLEVLPPPAAWLN